MNPPRPDHGSLVTGALYGAFIADALAMPVHWYYDTLALARDYGWVQDYLKPRNPHPDSILWRSSYRPPAPDADILHDQAVFWGKRGVHYHQFLQAGENTLNLKISRLLMDCLLEKGEYDPELYLERYVAFMTTPGTHRDTYVEECHREFFYAWALRRKGKKVDPPREKHIGGLSLVLPLLLFYSRKPAEARELAARHLELTHPGPLMADAVYCLATLLEEVLGGSEIRNALNTRRDRSWGGFARYPFEELSRRSDVEVAQHVFSTACYVQQSLPLTFFLAWKYQDDPERALLVNTNLGGDNCHRGVVLGALLGAMHGLEVWPQRWVEGLLEPPSAFAQRLAQPLPAAN